MNNAGNMLPREVCSISRRTQSVPHHIPGSELIDVIDVSELSEVRELSDVMDVRSPSVSDGHRWSSDIVN